MGSESQQSTIGDYFTLQRGTTYKSQLLGQPGPILLGLATIQRNGGFRSDSLQTYGGDSPDKLLVHPGELYVSLKDVTQSADLLGAIARLPKEQGAGRLTQDTVKLQPRSNDVPLDYLYWLMRTPQYRGYCRAHATGTTNLGLAREDFLAFPAPEPAQAQHIMVKALDALDDKIELNHKMNATLEETARTIFQSWFVDFDPVHAKAAGRAPAGLDVATAALFPDSFEEIEGRMVPRGWKVDTLDTVGKNARRNVEPAQVETDTPYIGLEHMPRKQIALNHWGDASDLESNKFKFKRGEILFGKLRPYFHKVGVAPIDGICSTDILVILPNKPLWFAFLLGHVSSTKFIEHTNSSSDGTKMPRTSWKDMARYQIITPTESLAAAYNDLIAPFIEQIIANIYASRTLAELRDTLLPCLLSGELRVRDVEHLLEE